MRRHVIIGRLGASDRERVPTATEEVATRLQLVAAKRRLDHGIGRAIEDLAKMGIYPSEVGLDLLVLAAHVHAADTRISRSTESQDSWTREIRLVVPVSDHQLWTRSQRLLERMLNFLTGDRWIIGFRPRPSQFAAVNLGRPTSLDSSLPSSVTLFSGGLDSLIGAVDAFEDGALPLLVSHAGDGATSDSQNTLFEALKRHYEPRLLRRMRLWMSFPKGLVRRVDSEMTTRARSFLFFAAGIFAGTGLGQSFTLRVAENGFIALNVPLDALRLGALSTRTTHPFYMARWNDLLNALGIPGVVENPYWDRTKGEMIEACANLPLLRNLLPSSISCASPTKARWQGHGVKHCGFCLPCLIRRAAIRRGLGGVDPTAYTITDLAAHVLDTRQAEGQQVRSFQFAIRRLRQRPGLAAFLIHKPGPLSDESAERQAALAEVHRRGLSEVGVLLGNVEARPS